MIWRDLYNRLPWRRAKCEPLELEYLPAAGTWTVDTLNMKPLRLPTKLFVRSPDGGHNDDDPDYGLSTKPELYRDDVSDTEEEHIAQAASDLYDDVFGALPDAAMQAIERAFRLRIRQAVVHIRKYSSSV